MSTESDIAAIKAEIARLQEQFRAIPSRWGGGGQLNFVQMGTGNTIGTYGGVVVMGIKYSTTPITVLPTLNPSWGVADNLSPASLNGGANVWVSGYFTTPGGLTYTGLAGSFPENTILLVGPPVLMPVTGSSELRPLYPLIKI